MNYEHSLHLCRFMSFRHNLPPGTKMPPPPKPDTPAHAFRNPETLMQERDIFSKNSPYALRIFGKLKDSTFHDKSA